MSDKSFYINTIGCQMNVYDSSRLAAALRQQGYHPRADFDGADVVIVNTCTIRAKARQKALSFIGRLARAKRRHPGMIIAIGGCVAQQEGRALLDKFSQVDIVFGTHAVSRLPQLIQAVQADGTPRVDVDMSVTVIETDYPEGRPAGGVSEFVTIMRGCDNYCTYCVVPYVRGRETSRHPEAILQEVRKLVSAGVREVTLLGQNVNSYGNKEGLCTFPELLAMVNGIDGLRRLRFTTSHPKDLSEELVAAFGKLDKLCNHFHLPVQSGSDAVLKRMNRRYTRDSYLGKLARLRAVRPDMAITTDLIVGFPGETEADFEATLHLLDEVRFDNIFAFIYSDRPLAPAAGFSGKISEAEKKRRLAILLERQAEISAGKNRTLEGTTAAVLVEGPSKRAGGPAPGADGTDTQWSGRTTSNKVVNFRSAEEPLETPPIHPGRLVQVKIDHGYAHSLSGRVVQGDDNTDPTRGQTNAA
ncbi:MAG: tRNA (N6-isopentenyl adenosine(37)-C2)-methylthiotransferase MiaB [Desulfosudaceae bacterium]